MPRVFWLALLLGYVVGLGGAVLFLPDPMIEPLYAGIAVASLAAVAGLSVVLGLRARRRPVLFAGASVAATTATRVRAAAPIEGERGVPAAPRLIATVEEGGISAAEMREILREGRVDAFVRPVVGLAQRRAELYHAVARLRRARGEYLGPDQYRPMAARCGLQALIDQLLVSRCGEALRTARADGRGLSILCRVSPTSLNDRAFAASVSGLLRDDPDLASRLVIELEQMRLHRSGREALAELVEQGLRLCLWRTSIEGLDPRALAAQGFAFVRIEAPAPAAGLREHTLDPRVLTLRRVLDQSGISLVLDQLGSARKPIVIPDRGAGLGGAESMRRASVA